ncbi:MAG: helix-turn-helix domain-containing protein, partial [Planctomycetaceae bacterium]|nr:helix-turn-helix domain-containing protein [Planctomycetaceae bacterium]
MSGVFDTVAVLRKIHPEDIKAALRKRFKSVAAFERAHGLPRGSVTDLFRGQTSHRVANCVVAALPNDLVMAVIAPLQSDQRGQVAQGKIDRVIGALSLSDEDEAFVPVPESVRPSASHSRDQEIDQRASPPTPQAPRRIALPERMARAVAD